MKGTLSKTKDGWIVQYWEINPYQKGPAGQVLERVNELPLIDNGHIDGLKLYDSNEGLEVDFEIVIDIDNNGPNHFPKFAKIITPEEVRFNLSKAELRGWDVTLNDGLENEPYVSDDFQIGPDGAYEHTEEDKKYTEDDIRKAINVGISAEAGDYLEGWSFKLGISLEDYFINSLNKQD
jgi:hypothetical protein